MSLIDKIFGDSNKDNDSTRNGWKNLTQLSQLEEIEDISASQPVVIFKHSTRCSISRMALKNFERETDETFEAEKYYLDLLAHRDISNAIADRFGVAHQSPQLLLISGGRCAYNTSHGDIDSATVSQKIRSLV